MHATEELQRPVQAAAPPHISMSLVSTYSEENTACMALSYGTGCRFMDDINVL